MKKYNEFLIKFMDSWKDLEGEKTCDLMAEDLEYFENPIDEPLKTVDLVRPLWAIVPSNQKDITYNGEILFEDQDRCIYHFTMKRTMISSNKIQNIDGIFEIKLDDNNKLKYFKQWRFTKEQ